MIHNDNPVLEASAPTIRPGVNGERLLDIDANEFRQCFDKRPFLIGHHLSDHPLFTLPRLIELSKRLPAKHVEYNAGKVPLTLDPTLTPQTGLAIDETIRRIEECCSWMVLKFVEQDDAYRQLLHRCLAEVGVLSEPLRPGMQLAEAFVFISSAGSVTPYHMDHEHNFLLQIRGTKSVSLFDGRDRSVLSEAELERFYSGAHRNLQFTEEYQKKAWEFEMQPGQGLHFPVTFPHHLKVGPSYSISFSITFRTPDLDRRAMVYKVNNYLRSRGWTPRPVGQSKLKDTLKCQAFRAWRRTSKLFGKSV